jgi:hypothetical protein
MSDLQDFTFYKVNASLLIALETASPILGTGSLKMAHNNAAGLHYANGVRAAGNKAFPSGRVRFLARLDGFGLGTVLGFAFNQSQPDLTSSGTAYLFYWSVSNVNTTHQLQIARCTAGIPTRTTLFTGPNFTLNAGVTTALECSWVTDLVNLGGIRFSVKQGSATNYSDLADVAGLTNVLTTTTLLTTSVGEGPAWYGGPTTQFNFLWDSMSCVPLIIG